MLDPSKFVVLSGRAGMTFTQTVIDHINAGNFNGEPVVKLGVLKTSYFEDGEPKAKLDLSIREKSVHLFQCFRMGPENLCFDWQEMLIVLDLLKRSGAAKLAVYPPYFPFQRQEKKIHGREPLSAKLAFDQISVAGGKELKRMVTSDLHTDAAVGFADFPVDNINAWPLFALYIKQVLKLNHEEFVIVAPDAGGAERARSFAIALNAPSAIIEKRRHSDGNPEVFNLIGSVEGKIAIMIDDIISTGGTLVSGQKLLLAQGAKKVYAFATHGQFNPKDGIPAEQRFYDANIDVVVTDSIPPKHDSYYRSCDKWLKGVVSLARFFADVVVCNETGQSLSERLQKHEKNIISNDVNIHDFLLEF